MPEVVPSKTPPKAPAPNAAPGKMTTPKGPRGEVIIFGRWCKGCHICVEFCPTGVLEFSEGEDHPHVAHPEKCTACHFCDTHCPDLAIIVKRLDRETP